MPVGSRCCCGRWSPAILASALPGRHVGRRSRRPAVVAGSRRSSLPRAAGVVAAARSERAGERSRAGTRASSTRVHGAEAVPSHSGPLRAAAGSIDTVVDVHPQQPSPDAVRAQRVARRRDVRAVPRRPGVGERDLAGVLRRLPAQAAVAVPPPAPAPAPRPAADARAAGPAAARRRRPAAPAPPRRRRRPRSASRSAARAPASSPTWRPASASRRPRASATSRPSCSRSTAGSSTATSGAPAAARSASPTSSGTRSSRAIADDVPAMNSTFVEGPDGKPRVVRHEHVDLGLAVDVEKSDGSRTLVVPVHPRRRHARLRRVPGRLRGADPQGPHQQARRSTTSQGATITLTNPGTIGTVQSVPRLMPGQGVIVGVGAHRLPGRVPGRRRAHARRARRVQGRHDHVDLRPPHHPGRRVGAVPQAGARAAARRGRLLRRRVPRLGVPYEAVQWRRDVNPIDREEAHARRSRCRSPTLIRVHRVRGHLIADLDPLAWKEPRDARRARPRHVRPHHLGPRPRVPHRRRSAGAEQHAARRHPPRAARRVLPHDRHRVHAHPGHRRAALDPGSRSRASRSQLADDEQRHILGGSTRPRRSRSSSPPSTWARSASASRAPSRRSRSSTRCSSAAADDGLDGAVLGMAHRGRLNVLANIVGKSLRPDLQGVRGLRRPRLDPGLGRREVPPRRDRASSSARAGADITVELAANPSHLEAVDPVVERHGARQQDLIDRPERRSRSCRS